MTDAQQVLNLKSLSEIRATMAAALASANVGDPLNPALTTQQLWDEFYEIVRQTPTDIESIITQQMMKFMYFPPAPGGLSGDQQVIFNAGGFLTGDPGLKYNQTTDTLTIGGNIRTGSGAAGSPSHSFGSDTNTGAYNPGPDIYSIVTGGVERLRVDASGNITASGTFTALGGLDSSSIRAAASDYAAVAFDGATSGTRIVSTLTSQNIGTGDMSMWNRFRVFTTTGTTRYIAALSSSSTTADQARACLLYINSIGGLVFYLYGATVTDFRSATIAGFQTSYSGQVVDIVVTRTGTTLKIYINGTDTAYSEVTGGTPPAWSDTITSTNLFIGQSTGTSNIFSGRIYRSVVFNRALSATNVTELITIGVNPADQWGSQTAVLNATFTGTTDSFIAAGAGVSVASVANQLEVTCTTATGGGALRTSTILNAKNYRVTFKARLQSGDCAGSIRGGAGQFSPIGATTTVNFTPTSVLTQYLFEFTNTADTSFYFRTNNTINPSVVEFDDLVIERIGAIVDLDFTVGAGYQATDRSTNALHGTLFAGVEFTQPKRVAVVYGTTSTATSQLMLGSFSIPTNAIIEDIIVNSSGTATVSIGPVTGGSTTIVNAASVVAGRQKLTIATPFSTSGNLYVTSSTTAVLQFTILYTIAA